jgi:hypothetical protein
LKVAIEASGFERADWIGGKKIGGKKFLIVDF